MSLSIEKLINLLESKGFIIKSYFTLKKYCLFIEIIQITYGDTFLLRLDQDKYQFQVSDDENVYRLKSIKINTKSREIVEEISRSVQARNIEESHYSLDPTVLDEINEDNKIKLEDLSREMIQRYKRPIHLPTIDDEEHILILKDLYRQIDRLKYCVQDIDYKLALNYQSYLCVLNKGDGSDLFQIIDYPLNSSRRLLISVDLKNLYGRIDQTDKDMRKIRESIYKLIRNVQNVHFRKIEMLLGNKSSFKDVYNDIKKMDTKYKENISNYTALLEKILCSEKEMLQQISSVTSNGTLQNDIDKSHFNHNLEQKLDHLYTVKDEAVTNMLILRDKRDHLSLTVDKILFDNIIMTSTILKNFDLLSNIL